MRPGVYVHVDYVSQGTGVHVRYQAVVHGFRQDAVGDVVELREFSDGKFTGRMRVARPDHMTVKRPPASLRALTQQDTRLEELRRPRGSGARLYYREVNGPNDYPAAKRVDWAMEVRPIVRTVPKRWGSERWIVNTDAYCAKVLTLKVGAQTSLHYHPIKRETFMVQHGILQLALGSQEQRHELLVPGECFDLPAGIPHRLVNAGTDPLEVLEVSTHHRDADSIRVAD